MAPNLPDEPIVVEYISAKRYRRVFFAAYGIGRRVVRSGLPVRQPLAGAGVRCGASSGPKTAVPTRARMR